MNEYATPVILSELTGDGVMLLTLNRPERHNAWTLEMELLYNELFDHAEADPAVRAVVLTGAGRSFCPGMDMSVLDGASSGRARGRPTGCRAAHPAHVVPKPLVAAVNGACAGIGFNQALMCDVRFAVPGAKFAAAFSARGLVAEDGVSWLLPRIVGYGNASDLLLSSRRVTGAEARTMGLVNRLVEPEELLPAALAYATELARSASPYAMSLIKRQLADDQSRSFTESRDTAAALLATAKRAPTTARACAASSSGGSRSSPGWERACRSRRRPRREPRRTPAAPPHHHRHRPAGTRRRGDLGRGRAAGRAAVGRAGGRRHPPDGAGGAGPPRGHDDRGRRGGHADVSARRVPVHHAGLRQPDRRRRHRWIQPGGPGAVPRRPGLLPPPRTGPGARPGRGAGGHVGQRAPP